MRLPLRPRSLKWAIIPVLLLIQLRWLAVGGQLATIGIVSGPMGISLSHAPLLAAILVLISAVTYASTHMMTRHMRATESAATLNFYVQIGFILISGGFSLAGQPTDRWIGVALVLIGAFDFAVMPRLAISRASDLVAPCNAALAAA